MFITFLFEAIYFLILSQELLSALSLVLYHENNEMIQAKLLYIPMLRGEVSLVKQPTIESVLLAY